MLHSPGLYRQHFGARSAILMALAIMLLNPATSSAEGTFRTNPPGNLQDAWGEGARDYTSYAPGMKFPVEHPTTTLNSQIRNPGGMFGGGGGQCSERNYNEVWSDTYCERRSANRASLRCTSRAIHQGNDIRGGNTATCRELARNAGANNVPVVAVFDGTIDNIGSFTVDLKTALGRFRYLHLNMDGLLVKRGDRVTAGQRIGFMSNNFGGASTTFHLHFEHWMPISGRSLPVPVYCDLVMAYERDTGKKHVMSDGSQRCDGGISPLPQPAEGNPATAASETSASGLQKVSFWRFNGAELSLLRNDGDRRVLTIDTPRPDMDFVKPGTVLFEGRKDGERYIGKMFDFKAGCPPLAFDAEGPVEDAGRTVVLRGARPQRGADCKEAGPAEPERMAILFQRPLNPPPPEAPAAAAAGPETPAANPGMNAGGRIPPRCTRATCVDRASFMQTLRSYYRTNDHRALSVWQEDALTAILNVWDTDERLIGERRLAYTLGTVYHETARRLYPVREGACKTDEGAIAVAERLFRNGKASAPYYRRDPETRQAYYGRGQVQVTFRDVYERNSKRLDKGDLLKWNADETLSPEISALLAVRGIYEGWFTGRKLKDFDLDSEDSWLAARSTIIGKRRDAEDVAKLGKAVLPMLTFIPNSEFQKQPGLPAPKGPMAAGSTAVADTGGTDGVPGPDPGVTNAIGNPQPGTGASGPSTPVRPPAQDTPIAVVPTTAQPAAVVAATKLPETPAASGSTAAFQAPDGRLLSQLLQSAKTLDSMSVDLQRRSAELSRQAAAMRSLTEFAAGGTGVDLAAAVAASKAAETGAADMPDAEFEPLPADSKAGEEAAIPVDRPVDFKTVWPPGHKESAWCRATDSKANDDIPLPADDPLVLLYGEEMIGLGGGTPN